MRALLLDVEERKVKEVEAIGLEDYYKMIDCRMIDIVNRSIGNKRYDIICDDEGLLKDNVTISAINKDWQEMLVGNLIICGAADMGELTDLTDDDIKHIRTKIITARTIAKPEGYPILSECEY